MRSNKSSDSSRALSYGGGPLQPPGVGEQEFEQMIDARVRCNGRPLFFANNTVEHSTLQICIVGLGGHEP